VSITKFMNNAEKRFASLLKTAFDKKNGNRIRHLVRIVADSYSQNLEELQKYFDSENPLVAGIATSAYNFLTDEISPIQKKEFGGLGAIINQSKRNLEFNRRQLWFAKISGSSLIFSKNSDDSLKYSENGGHSLWNSENSGNSLLYSKNGGHSLWNSKNCGDSLFESENSGNSLNFSQNSGNSLWNSRNGDYSLMSSRNKGHSLKCSENSGNSLRGSKRVRG